MRDGAATGVGFLQETSPGPEQTNVARITPRSQHSLCCLGDPGAAASPGPSLISTSLSPLQVPSVSPDPQGICKPKERSRRHPKDILNIHPKGATGTSPPAGQIPRVLQTKALPAWGGKWDLRMCCQFPRKGHGQEHLASSSHCFSSRSTQQQPPDTFTFGPTQSDPKYPGNNGLQERSRPSTSQGSETPGSLSGDNSQPGLP